MGLFGFLPKWGLVFLVLAALLLGGGLWGGCNAPSKADIQTTIAQTFEASNLSVLAQADWKTILTSLRGKVGPDFWLRIEGYTKSSAGLEIQARGSELSIETTASGTGGRDNSALWQDLVAVQTRYERADDRAKADRARWTQQVLEAFLADVQREQAAKAAGGPAGGAPGNSTPGEPTP
jgi:hypothetical protein